MGVLIRISLLFDAMVLSGVVSSCSGFASVSGGMNDVQGNSGGLSSMVILSMFIAFGSLVNLGVVKVLLVCVVVETPRRRLRISLTRLYSASYRDACSYHSPIVFGMVGCAKFFEGSLR